MTPISPPQLYSVQDVMARARQHMSLHLPPDIWQQQLTPRHGDHALAPDILTHAQNVPSRPAAVLIGLIERQGSAHILLTKRAADLRHHSGQIAFPGGKIDADDASPLAAALREAQEEIGLPPTSVTPLGYLDPWQTMTGYRIIPTLAVINEPFTLTPNESEVEAIFEVPVAFLMDPRHHLIHSRQSGTKERRFYAMTYGAHYIWGATAGILRMLYARLYES
jgi:8-oxo-dGTP pyrophosphatase MutT (NUDIX family)